MKKHKILIGIITTCIILISPMGGKTQNNIKKNSLSKYYNLLGKVKVLNMTTYKAEDKFGKIQKGDIELKENYFFNESGNTIEGNKYNPDGSLYTKWISKYDNRGNEIEWNRYESDGILSWKQISKYDEKGNKIEFSNYDSTGNLFTREAYKYNDKGNKVEELRYYKPDGSFLDKKISKYNEKENVIEENWYNQDGSLRLSKKYTYKYNDNGKIIETNYNPNGDPGINDFYLFITLASSGDSISFKYIYKYDVKGNKNEETTTVSHLDGSIYSKITSKSDSNGNTIEETNYNSDGSMGDKKSWIYDYDEVGNWIRKTELKNSFPISITEREIEYY